MDNRIVILFFLSMLFAASGCRTKDPTREDVPELITKATITFTPSASGTPVTVTATDPDNVGAQDIQVEGQINLVRGTTYVLSIQLVNGLYEPAQPGYDVTKQIEEEADEHQFFFAWNEGLFSDPSGNGNIDNRNDPLNYGSSIDKSGRPVGLTTTWTTANTASSGSNAFRILLKHQPQIKSATSTSSDGESDLDLTFVINVD
jgi:hypothetical protein